MQKNKIWILLSVILLIVIAILGYNLYEQKINMLQLQKMIIIKLFMRL